MKYGATALVCALLFSTGTASGLAGKERLEYDVLWAGISVGSAVLELEDKGSHINISAKADTARWVSVLYRVDDRLTSVIEKDKNSGGKRSPFIFHRHRRTLHEDALKREEELVFNSKTGKVQRIDRLENKKTSSEMKDQAFDLLSSFYVLRDLPLTVGKSVFINIFENMESHRVEVKVLKKEVVQTPVGSFSTFVIKPEMNIRASGLMFMPGDLLIWITDDAERIPVMAEKKVAIALPANLPEILKKTVSSAAKAKIVISGGVVESRKL